MRSQEAAGGERGERKFPVYGLMPMLPVTNIIHKLHLFIMISMRNKR